MTELLDTTNLETWLRDELGDGDEVVVERIGEATGVANALFAVRWGDHDLVLRRPPATKVTASAGDTMREQRILGALANTDVRHPRLVATCTDTSVIGTPFILMQRIDGFPPTDPLPEPFASDVGARRDMGFELIDALAQLATVDWRAVGLDGFGKPDGFLARQVDRWLWQLDSYKFRDLPDVDSVSAWLRDNLPEPGPVGIMHGDYSMFNVMFGHGLPTRLTAIVDWDTATIGEPLMDLGHVLARWDEDGEEPSSLGSVDQTDRTGLATRAELSARFAEHTRWDLSNLPYYEVVSLFKLGVIMEGHYAREIEAGVDAPRFADQAPDLFRDALRIARGERHP